MTYALVIAVFAVAALAYVAAPVRRNRDPESLGDAMTESEEAKLVALNAILDLENERDMGKLTDVDFAELRAVYEAQALAALHDMDAISESDTSDPVEREIARVRDRLTAATCSSCGSPLPTGADVCPRCGV